VVKQVRRKTRTVKTTLLFVAFAPRDNPKIAIAVVVENSGQGAWWAAPIASFIVEQYLKGKIDPAQQDLPRILYKC
jgi:cell division protein FtsI/penicillin-binding protein 2